MSRRALKIVFCCVLPFLLWYALGRLLIEKPSINTDDASITLVYAKHLAYSGALYYNLGEAPVDGFTSILDVLIKAFLLRFFYDAADAFSVVVHATLGFHFILMLLLSYVVFRFTDIPSDASNDVWTSRKRLLAFVGLISIFSTHLIIDGSATYLETPLFVFFGIGAVCLFPLQCLGKWRHILFFLTVALFSLARPEGVPLSLLIIAFYLHAQFRDSRRRETSLRLPVILTAAFLVFLAGYFGWRIYTFGYWAPNTYYAKTSSSRLHEIVTGLRYVVTTATKSPANLLSILLLVVGPFFFLSRKWATDEARQRYLAMSITAAVSLAMVLYSGGDSYHKSGRMLTFPVTLTTLSMLYLLVHYQGKMKFLIGLGFAIIMAVNVVNEGTKVIKSSRIVAYGPLSSRVFNAWLRRNCMYQFSEILGEMFPDKTVAQSDFQRLKAVADHLRVIDLHGLNNSDIAHQDRDGWVLFGKYSHRNGIHYNAPIWVFGWTPVRAKSWTEYSVEEVLGNPELLHFFAGYFGWPHGVLYGLESRAVNFEPPTPDEIQAISASYRLASLTGCRDRYLNFLIRKDLVEEAIEHGVLVSK